MTKYRNRCKDTRERGMVTVRVDRLVAETFVPNDDPVNKTEVYHIDGDRENSHANNLKWVTKKDMEFYEIEYDFRALIKRNNIKTPYKYLPENPYYAIFKDGRVYDLNKQCFIDVNGFFNINTVTYNIDDVVKKLFGDDIIENFTNEID